MMFKKYRAYGLIIESNEELGVEIITENIPAEVTCRWDEVNADDVYSTEDDWIRTSENEVKITVSGVAVYRIRKGCEIQIHFYQKAEKTVLRAYLFGVCFAFLLHQRGDLPIHGSCLYKDQKALLICGDSGSGKSTLASEFIRRGYQLMSDDIVPISFENGVYYARSSFPSQKMWKDTVEQADISEERLLGVVRRGEDQVKYQVDASSFFVDRKVPLCQGVMLTVGAEALYLSEVEGFGKVDLLMKNRFIREHVPSNQERADQLQKCIGLAAQMKLFLAERPYERNTVQQIADFLEKQSLS